jgi:hypothetical protein
LRGDGGFEDREGHQAPFTLREKENVQLPTSNAQHRTEEEANERLLEFFDRLDDVVEIRPVAGIEFGMEQFAIGANLEGAAARGNQRERLYALAELKNFRRQTDGFRRVVSNDAVFDRDFGLHRQTPFRESNYRRGFQWSRVLAAAPSMLAGDRFNASATLVMTNPSKRVQTDMKITEM